MSGNLDARFVLRRITPSEWVINDTQFAQDDTRHVVACVYELAATEVEVVWLRDLPLSSNYGSAFEVLEHVERVHGSSRATRPIPIPHRPPLLAD